MAVLLTHQAVDHEPRARIRAVLPNLQIGFYSPGPKNSITDVPGVLVHTQSIHSPKDTQGTASAINTGVTTILPRANFFHDGCHAGLFRFNGAGELTGSHWIAETGILNSPSVLTNTFSVGAAYQGVYEYCSKTFDGQEGGWFILPVIGETFDGMLNDVSAFAVKPGHVLDGINQASSDPVPEGNTGGGTGMVCHRFKGGTGSSSRVVPAFAVDGKTETQYTVGALVQANYGSKRDLRIGGAPVGRLLAEEEVARESQAIPTPRKDGSIIIILATDAPLHPLQLQRLARRATTGLARVGGNGGNSSGDIFLAFSTAAHIPLQSDTRRDRPQPQKVEVLLDEGITPLFDAAADTVEEAIYNVLSSAETTLDRTGKPCEALPLEKLKRLMEKYL